jgi:hypothetical protein
MHQADDRRVACPPLPVVRIQKYPSIRVAVLTGGDKANSRFFRNDLDKAGLRRINRSIGQCPGLRGGQTFEG